jgi:preprotein translocase, secE subunit
LKKVTTPTGRELIGYFLAVLLFVVVMLLLISGLDYLFGQGAFWIFGNGTIQRN